MYKETIIELSNMYIVALPLALMIQFTHDAIIYRGMWIVDMTSYGEYGLEIFLFVFWFLLAGTRTILQYRVQIHNGKLILRHKPLWM